MADDAARPPIPAPLPDDHEDVSWALSTALTTWTRGDRADALKWLRRAAEAASEAEQDDRALALAKAAAEIASTLGPTPSAAPPPVLSAAGSMPPAPFPPAPSAPATSSQAPAAAAPPPSPSSAGSLSARASAAPPAPQAGALSRPPPPVPSKQPPRVPSRQPPAMPSGPPSVSRPPPAPVAASASSASRPPSPPRVGPPRPPSAAKPEPGQPRAPLKPVGAFPINKNRPSAAPPAPTTAPDIDSTVRMASPIEKPSEDDLLTVQGKILMTPDERPSEPATPESKRSASGIPPAPSSRDTNAASAPGPRISDVGGTTLDQRRTTAQAAALMAQTAPSGSPRFSADEADAWPTQTTLNGAELADDDAPKTRIGSPAYRDKAAASSAANVSDAQARIAARPDGPVRTSQAVRVVVWRGADGVYVAPHGTTVTAISVDALLVALDPSADLSAWLSNK